MRGRWGSVALLLVVAFLGHDLLMASDAHTHQRATVAVHSHHPLRSVNRDTADQGDISTSIRVDGCDTVWPMVQQEPLSDDDTLHSPEGFVLFAVPLFANIIPRNPRWIMPTAPPGVRRAMLQVFLI